MFVGFGWIWCFFAQIAFRSVSFHFVIHVSSNHTLSKGLMTSTHSTARPVDDPSPVDVSNRVSKSLGRSRCKQSWAYDGSIMASQTPLLIVG